MGRPFLSADALRAKFAAALSLAYRAESPQYRALAELVEGVNKQALDFEGAAGVEAQSLGIERHGAIRVGKPEELATFRRLFAVLGLAPVGYYDLSGAGIPVHATAFRPIDRDGLRASPFRIFTSLLRLELIDDVQIREEARAILATRRIFSQRLLALLTRAEEAGGLSADESDAFVSELIGVLRWRGTSRVRRETHKKFSAAHPVLADVVCFDNPHINHLTLAALDIDAVHSAMVAKQGLTAKAIIEGPPKRCVPILLRQTSYKAVPEPVRFADAEGAHSARFGEVEQRGAALTAKGRALYDRLLAEMQASSNEIDARKASDYTKELRARFSIFPDDAKTLYEQSLAFFRYTALPSGSEKLKDASPPFTMQELIRKGCVGIEPIVYEDFLPISAAGIFRSNLSEERRRTSGEADPQSFEAALGAPALDELAIYDSEQSLSQTKALEALGLSRGANVG